MKPYIGQSIPRVEDARFLRGQGSFSDDIALPGQVYCAFLRSPHAHASIIAINTAQALRAHGVLAVLSGADYLADGLETRFSSQRIPGQPRSVTVDGKAVALPPGPDSCATPCRLTGTRSW